MHAYRFFGAGILHLWDSTCDACALTAARAITDNPAVKVFRQHGKQWLVIN